MILLYSQISAIKLANIFQIWKVSCIWLLKRKHILTEFISKYSHSTIQRKSLYIKNTLDSSLTASVTNISSKVLKIEETCRHIQERNHILVKSVDQHFHLVPVWKFTCEYTLVRNHFLVKCVDQNFQQVPI